MELSASELAALLLAHSRLTETGRGHVWGGHEASTADLAHLSELELIVLRTDNMRGEITADGVEQAERYCPVCGRQIPQIDGRRPPHSGRESYTGGARGSYKSMTKQENYWCLGGQDDDGHVSQRYDRSSVRNGKSSTFPRWHL
jgi:hypothetical protein